VDLVEIALVLAKNSFIVYATMRNLQRIFELKSITDKEKLLPSLRFVQLDVRMRDQLTMQFVLYMMKQAE
jgi:hypothetical protein